MKVYTQRHPIYENIYATEILEKGYSGEIHDNWEVAVFNPSKILNSVSKEDILYREVTNNSHITLIYRIPNGLAYLSSKLLEFRTRLSISVAGLDFDVAENYTKALKKLFKPAPAPVNTDVRLRFWHLTAQGPRAITRVVTVPKWDDINDNYTKSTKTALQELLGGFRPVDGGGQLVLWHGPPGTGKTYALRSLLREWRDWCSAEYILDPEQLFGYGSGYLAQLLLGNAIDEYEDDDDINGNKWRLLILEDTGELFTDRAKEKTGPGLSRLLNLADGLIGQGLRVIILITTNEEFENLHPAVAREGRCSAAIRFNPLETKEAEDWLNERGVDETLDRHKNYHLSDLFAKVTNNKKISTEKVDKKKNPLGFTSPIS